ncbi:hypothetical protein Tco_0993321 [Tanacetum coccineum]|uniref:Uncharacterized protein n=1 Tax=Tanacetum coccineum TaxID=301880 RepID=A0ABQ5F6R8_9ASTR
MKIWRLLKKQVVEDDHVTISTVTKKTEVPATSSSRSSDLALKFLNFSDILILMPQKLPRVKEKKVKQVAEPTTGPKKKDSTFGSSKGTKPQPKSFGKFVQSEEPVFEVADSDMPQDQEGNLGDNEDEPRNETASRRDWFKKPTPPQEPTDPDWNIGKTT